MSKSKEIFVTSNIVKEILTKDEQARNSDSYLFLRVLDVIGSAQGIDIEKMSVPTLLLRSKEYGFPGFETVRRTRQKIQQCHPELAGDRTVEAHRKVNEETFRNYARMVNV